MYHVEKINIKPKHPLFEFCDTAINAAKNMYNVANFSSFSRDFPTKSS